MRAMVLETIGSPLVEREVPDAEPAADEVRVRIEACGVCRTGLPVVDGELPDVATPVIPGHEIVGIVEKTGAGVRGLESGDRAGIPWLSSTCGVCAYCREANRALADLRAGAFEGAAVLIPGP